ncbi:cupin domain-containing protein [Nitratiruptor sp. SB155-2]|uniref:cupin domain-containing protein n=1 Tax=Nitratiruptor sp. (strain SB155-2) TaxID=387092 RepID=UPI00015871FF|nr:cupin domain-containing protein [Nitratiruptor sp. SB155-2]BAF69785.1 hypothetical protein NIS_0671 [Nitratiruptor sp. SB155-2]
MNNKALKIEFEAVKSDNAFLPGGRGTRKIIVTKTYSNKEEEVKTPLWKPPLKNEKCPVYRMNNVEMSFFTEQAKQERHYHKEGTEIYMVIEGEFIIEIENKIYRLYQGDTIIVPPFSIHHVKNEGNRYFCRMININCGGIEDKYIV